MRDKSHGHDNFVFGRDIKRLVPIGHVVEPDIVMLTQEAFGCGALYEVPAVYDVVEYVIALDLQRPVMFFEVRV